ncbi:MAG TPA: o-succinylbenzoate synthase [Jatrophihabitantaceae bacterium]|jgi:O-succinylbenzoate synthase
MTAVVRAELFLVRMPLRHNFRTSSHGKQMIEHIIVRLEARDGAVGWGECASPSDPYYGPENVDTCWQMLHDYLVPALLGASWDDPESAYGTGDRVRGNRFARAGLDVACWDLWTRARDESIAKALGSSAPDIEAGVSLGIESSVEELLEQVGRFVAEGYRRIKLKVAPGWDVEPLEAVRRKFGDIPLQVDANGAYPRGELQYLRRLDDFGLLMIEQPFAPDDLLAHAELQQFLRTPICLDESITSLGALETVLRLGAARVVNIKVSRLGGLGPARAVHDACFRRDIPVWCGGMHEFGIGRAANLALGALPGFTLPSDISGSDKYFSEDVVTPPITAQDGRVVVPYDRPGLGHDVVPEVVERYCVRRATVTANDS